MENNCTSLKLSFALVYERCLTLLILYDLFLVVQCITISSLNSISS